MTYDNTFTVSSDQEKQVYFLSKILCPGRKCTGIQNCRALQNAGLPPPRYYFTSSFTDPGSLYLQKDQLVEKAPQSYKNRERNEKVSRRKASIFKNKKHILESNNEHKYNIHAPKGVYVYNKKYIVKEVRLPRRSETSITKLHGPIRVYDHLTHITKGKGKQNNTHAYKNIQGKRIICNCVGQKRKKKKDAHKNTNVEPNILEWLEQESKKPENVYKYTYYDPNLIDWLEHEGDEIKDDAHKKTKHEPNMSNSLLHEGKNKRHKNIKDKHICKCPEPKVKKKKVQSKISISPENAELDTKYLVAVHKSSQVNSEPIKYIYEFDLPLQKDKKQKETRKNLKQKMETSMYHDYMKKVKFDDVPPEGKDEENNAKDDMQDTGIKGRLLLGQKCRKGLCTKAAKKKNYKFICKCAKRSKPEITECNDAICNKTSTSTIGKVKRKIICLCHKYSQLIKNVNILETNTANIDRHNISDIGQTGEPLFELKLSSGDMSALNANEIRTKVRGLGKVQKQDECICLSHVRDKNSFLPKKTCTAGICAMPHKNKKTYLKCKCQADKGSVCTNLTCERDINNISSLMKEPLLEVKFNAEDMRIINTEEVCNKMSDIRAQIGDICSAGICRDAANNKTKHTCKCKLKKLMPVIRECSENNCHKRKTTLKSKISRISGKILNKSETIIYKNRASNDIKPRINDIVNNNLKDGAYVCDVKKILWQIFSRSDKNIRKNNLHKRNGLSIPSIIGKKIETNASFIKCKRVLTTSYSALLKRTEHNRHKFRRSGLNIPFTTSAVKELKKRQVNNDACVCRNCEKKLKDCKCKQQTTAKREMPMDKTKNQKSKPGTKAMQVKAFSNIDNKTHIKPVQKHKKTNNECLCHLYKHHTCECELIMEKEKHKKKEKEKWSHSQRLKQQHHKRKQDIQKIENNINLAIKRKKEYLKELRTKAHLEKEKRDKLLQLKMQELEDISKEADETNCFADFCLGILNIWILILKGIFLIIFKSIFQPLKSYRYIIQKLLDPVGTARRVYKSITFAWGFQKLQMLKSINGSDKMSVLMDTLQDTAVFQAFSEKGRTPAEKRVIAQKNKLRKKRISQRKHAAFRNCSHALLHTLRKTPCIWIYHMCPFFYPNWLYTLQLVKNLTDIILFMVAFVFWTPCIACVEITRALCCCFLCTN